MYYVAQNKLILLRKRTNINYTFTHNQNINSNRKPTKPNYNLYCLGSNANKKIILFAYNYDVFLTFWKEKKDRI